jgi:hypothetical protein
LPGLLGGEPVEQGVEAVLTLPGVADHVRVLALLALPKWGPDGWAFSINTRRPE